MPSASGTTVTKASLSIMLPTPNGPGAQIDDVTFQFNPKEYSLQKSANWKSKPAKGAKQAPMPEFQGADPRSITIEIFLDATDSDSRDITRDVEKLLGCCTPLDQTVGQNKPSPPFVIFSWGTQSSVAAYVKQVQIKYTLFRPDGTPIRATGSMQLQEIPATPPRQNPTSGGLTARRSHKVIAGDSLAAIAHAEYGTPTLWRAVAVANGIDDPFRLPLGMDLLVPPESEAAELG